MKIPRMKRAGNLYNLICDPDNLRLAYIKAKIGKLDLQQKPGHIVKPLIDLKLFLSCFLLLY